MVPAHRISGTTQLYGQVGDPLAIVKSPELLNTLFVETGVDAVCIPFEVASSDLPGFVTGLRGLKNLRGLLVTMPHKQRMLDLVDELDVTAQLVGALNVIRCQPDGRWVGGMFDGVGCVLGMEWDGYHPANKNILLVGAGGAGRAIAFALASAGARQIVISDIEVARAEVLAASVMAASGCPTASGPADPRGFDIVINATALGMKPDDPMPVDPNLLEPSAIVIDIISSPTALVRAAQARGCPTQDGRALHEGQAVHSLRFLGFDYQPQPRH